MVVAAGGGGTLRAVVEGSLPNRPHVRVGGLRMGSGNVIPKRYGVPRDPIAAAHRLKAFIDSGSTRPAAVIRCDFGAETHHGVTMCGLGHFGRTSGDLVRFHERAAGLRKRAAELIPLERINDLEYVSSFVARMALAALVPTSCELVTVQPDRRLRLLAGVVLTRADRSDLSYWIVPRYGRPLTGALKQGQELILTLEDRRRTEFFLDEDPEIATGGITIAAAGTVDFVA